LFERSEKYCNGRAIHVQAEGEKAVPIMSENSRSSPREGSKDYAGGPFSIGVSFPRMDAFDKVTGREKYAADYYGKDPVWAGVKRAGVPHARLGGIDATAARDLPGVIAVLTHEDVAGANRQGVVRKDQPVLVDDKVRHCGDALALVLAEDEETLERAISLIEPDLEPIPGVFDMEDALAEDAPLVHEDRAEGNVLLAGDLTTGSGPASETECDVLVEARFETPRQEHAYLETEAGWAQQGEDGRLTIVCSTQTPFRDRAETAEALGLETDRVRIVAPFPGGAFGGKDGITVQSLLGLAALHSSGRPVKMWWSREESFIAGAKRHAARMFYRLGAKRDGTLHYLKVRLLLDTGPYDHLGGVVLALGLEHAGGPYRIPNAALTGRVVYTNNPVGGAFRGFGVTQVTAAMEQTMDMLAEELGVDPLELRLKNGVRRGDVNCVGKTLVSSTGLMECLERIAEDPIRKPRSEWKESAGPFKRRGVGMAAMMHATGYGPVVPDYAGAKVELTEEGKIRVYCGVVDMGQGNASTNAQIAGAILGQTPDRMELVLPDTDRTLPSGSASASRCTYTFGNALIEACEALKKRLLVRGAEFLMAGGPEECELIPGKFRHLVTGREIELERLAVALNDSERTAVGHFRAPVAAEKIDAGEGMDLHGIPHTLFSYAAHLAAVEIDELTGAVEVKKYLAVSDCGKIINPMTYEQQIHGGVAQGLGLALMEDYEVERGITLTPDFATYLIPTAEDVQRIESVPVEIFEPTGPYGLKGVGEIATNGPLPAVANAIADACGERIFRAPLTAERVLELVRGKGDPRGPADIRDAPAGGAPRPAQRKGDSGVEDVRVPASAEELREILEKAPDATVYAGGTDLLVKVRQGAISPGLLVCLDRIGEFKGARDEGDEVWIGACSTHGELLKDRSIARFFPVLIEALAVLGSPPIRNLGTIGGNIVTASPAGDALPALYVLGASLEISSSHGSRRVDIEDFISGPGCTGLKQGEILTGIRLKKSEYDLHHYEKVGRRRAQAIATASMAAVLKISPDGIVEKARFAWGSVGPTIVRCPAAEKELRGVRPTLEALKSLVPLVEETVSPIDDIRASAAYRRIVAGNLLLRLGAIS
jgi:CO/xanthine dehydrogenase Mo-binding subunit/CO/xanthine dehydrogenase FAD-binding subunit